MSEHSSSSSSTYIKIGEYEIHSPTWFVALLLFALISVVGVLAYHADFRRDLVCALTDGKANCTYWKDPNVSTSTNLQISSESKSVECVVKNPSGRPINLRQTPNGKDVGDIPNLQNVEVFGLTSDGRDRAWAKVDEGYLFMKLLECPSSALLPVIE